MLVETGKRLRRLSKPSGGCFEGNAGFAQLCLSGMGGGRQPIVPQTCPFSSPAKRERQLRHRKARRAMAVIPRHLRHAFYLLNGMTSGNGTDCHVRMKREIFFVYEFIPI